MPAVVTSYHGHMPLELGFGGIETERLIPSHLLTSITQVTRDQSSRQQALHGGVTGKVLVFVNRKDSCARLTEVPIVLSR